MAHGQRNAASSLGLTPSQTLRYVIGPQALRLAVPSLSNSLISMIKDTSLVSVIAVSELMLAVDFHPKLTPFFHLKLTPPIVV